MPHRLLNLLTVLSLLLCVAVGALWGRSHVVRDVFEREYFRRDGLPGVPGKHHLFVVSWYVIVDSGDLYVARLTRAMVGHREPEDYVRGGEGWRWDRRSPGASGDDEDGPLSWIGVSFFSEDTGTGDTTRDVTVPLWLVAAAFAALPAARLAARLRRLWLKQPGLCPR